MELTSSISIERLEKVKKGLKVSLPYLCILVATFLAFYYWITVPGVITGGDDYGSHMAAITDLLYGFENGFFDSTGHLIFGNLAYSPYLLYAHLAQYCAAGFAYLFSFMGAGQVEGIKFVAITSVLFSGVYSYLLAKKITKNDIIATIFAVAYVFMPYRLFCFYYRFAFPEAVALAFIPVLFYGLYSILHDEKAKASSYTAIIIGAFGLILNHPFTAFLGGFAGVLFLLFNIKLVIKLFKDVKKIIYTGIALILCFTSTMVYVVPMIETSSLGIYIYNDAVSMWTTLEHCVGTLNLTYKISGLINYFWLEGLGTPPMYPCDTTEAWTLSLCLYPFLCFLVFLADYFLKKIKLEPISLFIVRALFSFSLLFVPALIIGMRLEVFLGLSMFYVSYIYICLIHPLLKDALKEEEALFVRKEERKEVGIKKIALNPNIYLFSLLIIICFLYLTYPGIWEISPDIVYQAQFPFRFWGLAMFAILMLLLYIAAPFSYNKIVQALGLGFACFLMVVGQGMIDKRISNYEPNSGLNTSPSFGSLANFKHWGTSNEYLPEVLEDIYYRNEHLSYPNSLAYFVSRQVINRFNGNTYAMDIGLEDYIEPVYLEGEGNVTVSSVKTPEATFNVNVTSTEGALLQIPQIYYPGYSFHAIYEDGTNVDCEVKNVDGLVAAYIPTGTYKLEVTYPGTTSKQVGTAFLFISIFAIIGFNCYEPVLYFIEKKKSRASKTCKE